MKHYGDITKIEGNKVPSVHIITGGSPCQDLSIAGKREGLAGARSGLFMEQIRLIKEMRNECARQLQMRGSDVDLRLLWPRYMVWENVAGAFSSNKGEDFRCVLEETAKIADENAVVPGLEGGARWPQSGLILGNGYSIAWRLHDLQYFGCPQRRKRICLLADFNGDTAGKILFELRRETADGKTEQTIADIGNEPRPEVQPISEGLSGHIEQGGAEREGTSTDAEGSPRKAIGGGTYDIRISSDGTKNWRAHCYETEISRNLDTGGEKPDSNHGGVAVVFEPGSASRVGGHVYEDDKTGTLRANAGDNQQSVVYGMTSYESNSMKSDNPHSGIYKADTTRTLDNNGGNPACNQGGMIVLEGNGSRESHQGDGYKESDTMYTLNTVEQHAVCTDKCLNGWDVQSKHIQPEDGKAEAPYSGECRGGGGESYVMCLNDQGGSQMSVTEDKTATLRSEEHGHQPLLLDKEKRVYDWHRQDTRMTELGDVCTTAAAGWGGGGNNMPYVLESTEEKKTYANDACDKFSESDSSATLKQSGGIYGGGQNP